MISVNNDNFNPYAGPNGMYHPPNMTQSIPSQDELGEIMHESSLSASTPPPQNAEEFYTESFSDVLVRSIGYFVVCEFLIGTGGLEEKSGILYAAGNNFITLYDRESDSYTICDFYAVKFVTVYNSRVRPAAFTPRSNARMAQSNGRTMR